MTSHIFLLGFMGAGKSWWGRQLAARLACPFLDLDEQIETHAGITITDIFRTAGEATFREMERACLHALLTQPPSVVATGGGTPCFFDNLHRMQQHGLTVYLQVPVEVICERLRLGRANRPLLAGVSEEHLEDFIRQKLKDREVWYTQAHVTVTEENVLYLSAP